MPVTVLSLHTPARIDRETCQCLSTPGRQPVITAGVLAFLDLLEHPMLAGGAVTGSDLRHAVWLLLRQGAAAAAVTACVHRRGEYPEDAGYPATDRPGWLQPLEDACAADSAALGETLTDWAILYGADSAAAVADALRRGIAEAMSGFEILANTAPKSDEQRRHGFSPEWLAGFYHAVAAGASLTWEEFLWQVPLAALAHQRAALDRANSKITERPLDLAALAAAPPSA
jgi:hypothetical protein